MAQQVRRTMPADDTRAARCPCTRISGSPARAAFESLGDLACLRKGLRAAHRYSLLKIHEPKRGVSSISVVAATPHHTVKAPNGLTRYLVVPARGNLFQ